MDLIAQGTITENFIEPSFELLDTFNLYFANIMPAGSKGNMAYPFPRLKTDGFWHLIPNAGYENQINIDFSSMTRLREVCAGAKLDNELFQLMSNPETREQLRAVLIQTYFAPEVQPLVAEQGSINLAAYEYGKELLREVKESVTPGEDEREPRREKIRDQGFRKAIVNLYEHRCALCGIRMLTPDGHTVVDAAHIVPWKESYDDHPTNGMCLCKLCHWSFDEGLMSVGKKYEVLVSKRVRMDRNMPGHMLTLTDRQIFRPNDQIYWPGQENLRYELGSGQANWLTRLE
jgi:putative restriction endonuclease